ncbi:MAG TPA: MOSC domain-containing protein [Actinophytocola sp.]|jgi:ferredoxin-NADP reductase/MOSC domain-containing protein YiiM|uniref:MOSC domain-containing protein n=1 Tax=Actinophytocola sp. TaxID=1872138 RepID=UPI002F9266BD
MPSAARLLSVNVGMPKDVAWQGRTVHTGVWKYPVGGPRMVRTLNVDGDGQGDLGGHGGEMRAVLVYQVQSYEHWRRHFGRDDLDHGQFGENFTVDGLPDDEVCIGDRYRIGEAEFEVSQPRVTCFRVGMRFGEPTLPALLVAHHRPGFYLRVIREGHVQAGDEIVRTRTGRHALTVADTDALLYLPGRDMDKLRAAIDIPALSPGWQQSFRELLDTPAPPAGPAWEGFRRLRVTDIVAESASVASVHLAADEPLPPPGAGQYLTVRAAGALRSYSLSSDPAAGTYRISVKREPDGLVSGYLHTKVRPGVDLDVAAPRGEFVLAAGTNPVLLVSAGIGVTPVLAMLHELAARHPDREVWWLHTARDAEHHAFAAEAHELLAGLPASHEHTFYTATGDRLTRDALAGLGLPAGATAYICGPAGFMDAVGAALATLGVTDVHTEMFGSRSAINPGVVGARTTPPHQPAGPPGTGPSVTFVRSELTVRADERSLLELAEACDVPTRWSCRTGVCHTCVTPVLSGTVVHDPVPLEPPGPGEALICSARPTADLILDL